jgi:signal peptide peptidase-like protein 2B
MFSINMLKVLRLPSLRICTILLSALFFYDIFFVFITPLFMSGKSVMVEVATGHSSDEQLPMVLRVPHLSTTPSRVCYMQTYSLLGFGDILVPGLLLSYAHSYDLLAGIKYKLYWIITSVAYILGLVATFISLFLMNSAQPALLYLVPFTLIPTIIVAWLRGDLPAMWEGDNKAIVRRNGGAAGDGNTPQAAQDEEDGDVCGDDSEGEDEDEDEEDETKRAVAQDPSVSTPDKNKLLAQ